MDCTIYMIKVPVNGAIVTVSFSASAHSVQMTKEENEILQNSAVAAVHQSVVSTIETLAEARVKSGFPIGVPPQERETMDITTLE